MNVNDLAESQGLSKGWEIAIGVILALLGLFAIFNPFAASFGVTIALGWLFIIGGIARIIYAFKNRALGDFWVKLLLGLLELILGIVLLSNVIRGTIWVVIAIGIFIFIEGCFEVILAFKLRHQSPNWGWTLLSGVITVILGVLIWSLNPVNTLAFLGLLVGISFLISGIWTVIIALREDRPRRGDLA